MNIFHVSIITICALIFSHESFSSSKFWIYTWNGQQYPTKELAEAAMRSGLEPRSKLENNGDDISADGKIIFRYAVTEPVAPEPIGSDYFEPDQYYYNNQYCAYSRGGTCDTLDQALLARYDRFVTEKYCDLKEIGSINYSTTTWHKSGYFTLESYDFVRRDVGDVPQQGYQI